MPVYQNIIYHARQIQRPIPKFRILNFLNYQMFFVKNKQ